MSIPETGVKYIRLGGIIASHLLYLLDGIRAYNARIIDIAYGYGDLYAWTRVDKILGLRIAAMNPATVHRHELRVEPYCINLVSTRLVIRSPPAIHLCGPVEAAIVNLVYHSRFSVEARGAQLGAGFVHTVRMKPEMLAALVGALQREGVPVVLVARSWQVSGGVASRISSPIYARYRGEIVVVGLVEPRR